MIGNFTPDLLNRMAQSPALTARLASTRITPQQRQLMEDMTTLASKTPGPKRNPSTKTASPYADEWSRLPATEQLRQGSMINFAHRRINGLIDAQGQPTSSPRDGARL